MTEPAPAAIPESRQRTEHLPLPPPRLRCASMGGGGLADGVLSRVTVCRWPASCHAPCVNSSQLCPLTSLLRRLACQYPADGIQSEEVACVPRTHGLVPRNHHG